MNNAGETLKRSPSLRACCLLISRLPASTSDTRDRPLIISARLDGLSPLAVVDDGRFRANGGGARVYGLELAKGWLIEIGSGADATN